MKKIILLISVSMMMAACSNSGGSSGGGSGTPGNDPSGPNNPSGGCQAPQVTASSTNLEIAKAFNQWRSECSPSDADLDSALGRL